jgi:hypothetical protein
LTIVDMWATLPHTSKNVDVSRQVATVLSGRVGPP